MNAKLLVGVILAGMAVLFIFQNVMPVQLTFLFWTLSMSKALLMFPEEEFSRKKKDLES